LSNTNATHWAQLADEQKAFDVCIASHLTGLINPNRAADENALQHRSVSPGSVYFFDDLLPNVEAARPIGINAFHVRGIQETQAAIRSVGIDANA
jgi:glucose-1-phosphatase